MSEVAELSCKEVVELVTEYVEGLLPEADRARFEDHVMRCEGCQRYIDQIRKTIVATGAIDEDAISPEQLDRLAEAFRNWGRG